MFKNKKELKVCKKQIKNPEAYNPAVADTQYNLGNLYADYTGLRRQNTVRGLILSLLNKQVESLF